MEQMNWLATPSDRWILHPNHYARLVWDLMALVISLFECVSLPMTYCFDIQLPEQISAISTCFFTIDMFLSFMTGYFRWSLLIMRRQWLVLKYLRTWFVLD